MKLNQIIIIITKPSPSLSFLSSPNLRLIDPANCVASTDQGFAQVDRPSRLAGALHRRRGKSGGAQERHPSTFAASTRTL
jgi:hypothetical protein